MREDKNLPRESGPQPDPILRKGRLSGLWVWLITMACVAIVAGLLIAISPPVANNITAPGGPASTKTPRTEVPSDRESNNTVTVPNVAKSAGGTTGTGFGAR